MNLNYQLTNDFADFTSIIWIFMDVTGIPCLSDAKDSEQVFFNRVCSRLQAKFFSQMISVWKLLTVQQSQLHQIQVRAPLLRTKHVHHLM
jgi:hypothetical protein